MTHEKLQSEIISARVGATGIAKRDYEDLLHSIDAARYAGGMESAYPAREISADEREEITAILAAE